MVLWLRALDVLVEDLDSAPSTPMAAHRDLQLECQSADTSGI